VNKTNYRVVFPTLLVILFFETSYAQTTSDTNTIMSRLILVAIIVLLFGFILLIAEKLLQIQAMRSGEKDISAYSIFPQIRNWFHKKPNAYVRDAPIHYLKQGYDLPLNGEPEQQILESTVSRYAINAMDFRGLPPIPKVIVTPGQEVLAGDVLFFDKNNPQVVIVAPVSGEVIEVNRGEKRAISTVVLLADKSIRYKPFLPFDLGTATREQIVNYMCEAGVWPMIIERPFGTIANTHQAPKNIFISCFDSAPLAPDLNFVVRGKETEFQKGLDVLNKLTGGKVHLGLDASGTQPPSEAFTSSFGVEKHWFAGKHPTGNVGIQIHHIDSIKKGHRVWTLGVQEVISIGALFLRQRHEADRLLSIGGSSFLTTGYIKTYIGASLADLTANRVKENSRLISGDVFSGLQETPQGYSHYFNDQISAIPEGNHETLFGWALPRIMPTVSGVFPNKILGDIKFDADTNTNGEPRAFVMTGQYEPMLPMDIYPQLLMKAIITKDIDRMEGLGIQELAEEDIALCEFACTSKQPLQSLLREGLNMIHSES